MGKKKFLREDEDDNSTDDEANNSGLASNPSSIPACPHVGKAVNISDLKKACKSAFMRIGKCSACERDKKSNSDQKLKLANGGGFSNDNKKKPVPSFKKPVSVPQPPPVSTMPKIAIDPSVPCDIWLCLRCGGQSCSPRTTPPVPENVSHAMQHYETPRSDLHCVVLNVTSWTLWCFECKSELYIDSYKKLHEAVDHVKRVALTKNVNLTPTTTTLVKKDFSLPATSLKNVATTTNSVLPRARGLNNLGNTCFFNSVMQCLSATHPFVRFLDTHCQKGAPLNMPCVTLTLKVQRDDSGLGNSRNGSTQSTSDDQGDETDPVPEVMQLDPLSLQLAEAGSITLSVAAFFKEMHSIGNAKTGPVNPGHLFGQICRRSPQFRGFQQQDAHELLRHLMDGLRSEEVRRQKTAILKHFGLTEKTDPKKVDDKIRRKLSALSKHSNYTLVDKIFGGHLVSTIVCEQCHNSSQIYEPFLDLSLPLIDQKPPRPGGSATKTQRNSVTSNASLNEDEDISCFGRNKKKVNGEADSQEGETEFAKSKHQLKKEKMKAKKENRRNKNRNKNYSEKDEEEKTEQPVLEEQDKPVNPDGDKLENSSNLNVLNQGDISVPEVTETNGSRQEDEVAIQTEVPDQSEADSNTTDTIKNENVINEPTYFENVSKIDNVKIAKIKSDEIKASSEEIKIKSEALENEKSLPPDRKKPNRKPVNPKRKPGNLKQNGSEEEDEDDGYSEEKEEDWEWDYGEQWNENEQKQNEENAKDEQDSDYLEVNDVEDNKNNQEVVIKQSLNPLPPELLERGSSEREKSSELVAVESDAEAETGASFNGDVEDNLEDSTKPETEMVKPVLDMIIDVQPNLDEVLLRDAILADPYCPDSNHLDPHMEALCRRVRKLSVASSNVVQDMSANDFGDNSAEFVDKKVVDKLTSKDQNESETDDEAQLIRMRQDWIARSLTSIAPRYHSKAGECSIYSSLSQFTAPELLTGSNRWACDRCTQLASRLRGDTTDNDDDTINTSNTNNNNANTNNVSKNIVNGTNNVNDNTDKVNDNDSACEEKEKPKKEKKIPTVYSNASKQLLLFSPPAVLTIHLKRFQQTLCGLRKDNRHVEFPFTLNLAPFCSATSLSAANVLAGSQEIAYNLFGIVEHSGKLQGGHYTAFVKVRPANSENFGAKFHSEPTTRSEDFVFLLSEIERKCREKAGNDVIAAATAEAQTASTAELPVSKWYHISDSSVAEVSEERVLKSQAYLLFYERVN